jgi:hypothetical protein
VAALTFVTQGQPAPRVNEELGHKVRRLFRWPTSRG